MVCNLRFCVSLLILILTTKAKVIGKMLGHVLVSLVTQYYSCNEFNKPRNDIHHVIMVVLCDDIVISIITSIYVS